MNVGSSPIRQADPAPAVALGLRANWRQFWLLVLVNAFVGAMVGMERTVLPLLAQAEFGLASKSAVLSFIGLIHAPEVGWAASPSVALGYLMFGIVCVAYSFLPGAKDPVEIDESDVVAGH